MTITVIEGISGLVASIIAIIGAFIIGVRYLGRKFDKWANAVIENSTAIRHLTDRVFTLEGSVKTLENVMSAKP